MGDPKFPRKKYETPTHPWEAERIEREREIIQKYGLKNKREIWRAATFLRKLRGHARELFVGMEEAQTKKETQELLQRMIRLGLLPANSQLDDVLTLTLDDVLSRRLQTQVYLRGMAYTPKQARQMITHGHIAVNGRKVRVPAYMVKKNEENAIAIVDTSPLAEDMHPMRPKAPETMEQRVAETAEEA
ncbi:MAG: 30S ribosomal protein S4 [Candidatus Thermoplasmatota archaeon]|nr:30S ribosomal protein S4 [Candidatus Thermoplasmatota archaeon]